ncbi:hypothetical protein FRC02_011680 [Tulasnella sp. 418]|nr:hypothetical protein FRC02_011680 [Tulasnella sp. 418]
MSNYTTVDTTFDGPEPTRDPRSAPVTVTVSATTKEGSIVTRSVKVQQDTKITSLIDAVLSVEGDAIFHEFWMLTKIHTSDNLHFPTLITGFFPSGAVQTQNNTILPKAVRTSYRYETFDVTVTDQSTCWAPPPSSNHHPRPLSGTALQYDYPNLINLHDPFVKMWNRLTRPAEGYVAKTVEDKTIKYQDLEVSFRRTVRVPNDGRSHPLPADLGPFELVNVAKYSNNLPEFMRRKGFAHI